MSKRLHPLLAAIAALALLMPATATATTQRATSRENLPAAGRVIVRFSDSASPLATAAARTERKSIRSALVQQLGDGIVTAPEASGFLVATLSSAQILSLSADPRVSSMENDQVIHLTTDESNPASWGLDRIDEPSLPLDNRFHTRSDGAGVDVYIIDTGVNAAHSNFGSRVLSGKDYVGDGRAASTDCNGHGSHVAGTAAGEQFGVARSATIIPVRVLDCDGSGYFSSIEAGLDWVVSNAVTRGRPSVINISAGASGYISSTVNAVERTVAAGITVVTAGGNENADACSFSPGGAAPSAITVGATTATDARANFSNYGGCLDIFAPGESIVSVDGLRNSGSAVLSGTSMAAPHVTGAVALVLSSSPSKNPAEIRQALLDAANTSTVTNEGAGSTRSLLRVDELGNPLAAPSVVVAPSITGSARVGQSLSGLSGTWSGSPTLKYEYAWHQCADAGSGATATLPAGCSTIRKATRSAYTVSKNDAGKYLRLQLKVSNGLGSQTYFSAATGVIQYAPENSSPPTIIGASSIGATLSGSGGTWAGSPSPTLAYTWYRCSTSGKSTASPTGCTAVTTESSDAVALIYTILESDVGAYLRLRVTATNEAASASYYSASSGVVGALPLNTSAPTITGVTTKSQTLTGAIGTWTGTPTPTYTYSWFRCTSSGSAGSSLPAGCSSISRSTRLTFKLSSSDVGRYIRFSVTAKNGTGSAMYYSATTNIIAP